MKSLSRDLHYAVIRLIIVFALFSFAPRLVAEPLTLKHAVDLALAHGTTAAVAGADEQRAYAAYRETRDAYVPQLALGSGLGQSWGYPLTLEGSAPSIVNFNAQSALLNPALRDFIRASRTEWQAATQQAKDQRAQTIQDTVLNYVELAKWETLLSHLHEERADASKMEDRVNQRISEGVDSGVAGDQARLNTARVDLRIAQAEGSIEVLRSRLAHATGLQASAIEIEPESVPSLPEVKQEDDLAGAAAQSSPAVLSAQERATAFEFRAHGEHRSLLPSVDFAAQYALLATYNHYQDFFRPGSFERHNATIGVVIRFPFFNASQHARAEAADADALRARRQAEGAKNQVSEETLRLQRLVGQLSAAQRVADLEYKIAQSGFSAMQIRTDQGSAGIHDQEDARIQANDRFSSLQDANFELERARVTLLRATGQIEDWVGVGK